MKISKVQTTRFYRRLVWVFAGLGVAVLATIVYFAVSKTTIRIQLTPKPASATATVFVTATPDKPSTAADFTVAGSLSSTDVEGTKEFTAPASEGEVPAQATGTVTIINNWSTAQPLAATTRLLSPDGVLFRIKDRVDVPAGSKLENVAVYADLPGAAGNLEPTRFTIPGLWPGLQEKIYAESTTPMTGGMRNATVLTQSQYNESLGILRQELLDKAAAELEQSSSTPVSQQALAWSILKESSTAPIGTEASSYTLSLKLTVTAVLFDQATVRQRVTETLVAQLPADEKLSESTSGALSFTVTQYSQKDQTALLSVSYTGGSIPRLSHPMFDRTKLAGKDRQEVSAYFSNFDTVKNVDIHFSPFWVTRVPTLKDHVEIQMAD